MSRLQDKLDALRALEQQQQRRCRLARRGIAWLVVAALLVLGLDAAWSLSAAWLADGPFVVYELPVGWRVAVSLALGLGLVFVAAGWRLPRRVRAVSDTTYARRYEQAIGVRDERLVTATELPRKTPDDQLTRALSGRSVARADRLVASVSPPDVLDSRPWHRQRRRLAITAIAVAVVVLVAPWVGLDRLALRYVLPTADLPPLTWTRVAIDPPDQRIAVGDDARITLRVAGRPADAAQVRLLSPGDDGPSAITVPLADMPAGRAATTTLTLSSIDQPIVLEARANHGRSQRITINPVRLPRVLAVDLTISHDGRTVPLRYPPPDPVRALAGSELRIAVQADMPGARLDHAAADGRRLVLPVIEGEQHIRLRLLSPAGLPSRNTIDLTIVGMTRSDLARLTQPDGDAQPIDPDLAVVGGIVASDAVAAGATVDDPSRAQLAQLQSGDPTDADLPQTGDEPRDPDTASDGGTAQGGTGGDGSGTGGQPPDALTQDQLDELAVGLAVRKAGGADVPLPPVRAFAGRAPRAYRQATAAYYLQLHSRTEADREADPQPEPDS